MSPTIGPREPRAHPGYRIVDPLLGELSPTIKAVTKALTQRDRMRLQPSGAYALNLLGLSDQVPAKIVFLTEGESRKLTIGPMVIELRRTTPRNMAAAGRLSGLIIQAFRSLGKEHVTAARVERLKRTIRLKERRKLLKDIALTPAWMHSILREIAESQRARSGSDACVGKLVRAGHSAAVAFHNGRRSDTWKM